jgi:murein DD-endopeptidase MepM/ murein hydrolase activator NlpD
MRSRFHTIVFVPHSQRRTRQFRVSSGWLRTAAAAAALVLGFVTWATVAQVRSAAELRDLARMERENEELRRANDSFETSISRLQQALTDAEDRTRDLAIVAGLEQMVGGEPENRPSETGAGGSYASPTAPNSHDLSLLEARASRLDGQLDEVNEAVEDRLLLLRSTPMTSPVRGVINSGFGFRRDPITGQRSHHDGIDISADRGQPVFATADGIVVRAERAGNLGRAVYMVHRFGYETRFGHLSKILVEEGREVRRGDTLGWVGNSGRATGYHLHYEVRLGGDTRDPFEFMRDQG